MGPATRAALDRVAAAFTADLGDVLVDPDLVRDRCDLVSAEFAQRCAEAGVPALVVHGVRTGVTSEFPGATLVLAGHIAVLVGDGEGALVYDWTARQFDPTAPVPLVQPEAAWRADWPDLGEAP